MGSAEFDDVREFLVGMEEAFWSRGDSADWRTWWRGRQLRRGDGSAAVLSMSAERGSKGCWSWRSVSLSREPPL